MKRLLLIVALCICALHLKAQDKIEFMGLPLGSSDTTAFCSVLKDKGYTYLAGDDECLIYKGRYSGFVAEVMIVTFEGSANVNSILFTIYDLTAKQTSALTAELNQKFAEKYPNLKKSKSFEKDGSNRTMYYNSDGFVAVTDKMASNYRFKISVTYHCENKRDGSGIGIDDM